MIQIRGSCRFDPATAFLLFCPAGKEPAGQLRRGRVMAASWKGDGDPFCAVRYQSAGLCL